MQRGILITGGAHGIGKQICLDFLRQGDKVCFIDINEEASKRFESEYHDLYYYYGDVANPDTLKNYVDFAKKRLGRIDVLVNNAGITKDGLLMRMKESDFDAVIDVNLKGTWNCMKHATKIMMKQRYGRIISMSSVVGVMGNAGQVNYSASKAGIIGMTMSLAREVGSRGITVNAVAPGFIQTAMTDVLPEDIKESMAKQIPLGTFGQVSDIANTVVFLASDDARYITGQTIHVDGGMAM